MVGALVAPSHTQRFSGRSLQYAQARPGYPPELFDHLFAVGVLSPGARVVDLGSGTGIFSEQLLDRGLQVQAVEPNPDMRSEAEARLGGRDGFASVPGTAERTGLPDASMDAATAAQSFHWFDVEATRTEMRRVLRPGGEVVMVWNDRDKGIDEFHRGYSRIVDHYAWEKEEVDALRQDPEERFYLKGYHLAEFHHSKAYDRQSLECLVVSSSYMPKQGEEGYEEMISEVRALFDAQAVQGAVRMRYTARCYHGRVD
jgi:ubiquinone/menaquinone biosynthesis C-methylase UbiE